MLRFFRQIRQRLLTENWFSKYLLYAIGEILLVVIGILIALQIDAWQRKKERAEQESYYLTRLQAELGINIMIAKQLEGFKRFQNSNALLVHKILNERLPKDSVNQDFFLALEHLTWRYRRNFQKDVWEELKSTGNIDLISDQELRTRISYMYTALEFFTSFEEEWETYTMHYRRQLGDANIFSYETRAELTRALRPWGAKGVVRNLPDSDTTIARLKEIGPLNGYLSDIILSSGAGIIQYSLTIRKVDSLRIALKQNTTGL